MNTNADVEIIATRLMGWVVSDDPQTIGEAYRLGATPVLYRFNDGSGFGVAGPGVSGRWDPFTSADADVQVLERVREGDWWNVRLRGTVTAMDSFWAHLRREWANRNGVLLDANHALCGTALSYSTGDYAHAARAVLKEMEKTEEGR